MIAGRELAERIARELGLGPEPVTPAINPGHRVPFHWPPHPVSYGFHVKASDWTDTLTLDCEGEDIPIRVARTEHGVFGRWEELWLEAMGPNDDAMLDAMCDAAEPMLARQRSIAKTLGMTERCRMPMAQMSPDMLVKLLYCPDRDVARTAESFIEQRTHLLDWGAVMEVILRDRRHPYRRIAQWCVLDLCEDLPGMVHYPESRDAIIDAIGSLLLDAEDDYARAVFKAGTVLGGHLPSGLGEAPLLKALDEGTPIGRRAAIHGLYHVVEWSEERQAAIVARLRAHAETESEPSLAQYARDMALDVENGTHDHAHEPTLPQEA